MHHLVSTPFKGGTTAQHTGWGTPLRVSVVRLLGYEYHPTYQFQGWCNVDYHDQAR